MRQCSAYVGESNDTVYLVARNIIDGGPSIVSNFRMESSLQAPATQLLGAVQSCFNACVEIDEDVLYDSDSLQTALDGLFAFLEVKNWQQLQERYRCVELTSISEEIEIIPTKRKNGEFAHLSDFAERSQLEPNSFRALFLQQLALCR
ncbi:MAG TPA: hypothetical protein VJ180_07140 [Pyrinomonadaceae bacterium]|nr:hypothetical protein [Pyrinomonadaceae bacterium]